MKLSDLKTGMWVKFRNGDKAIVLKDYETKKHGTGLFALEKGVAFYSNYDENLKSLFRKSYDITEVFRPEFDCFVLNKKDLISIWKRKEKPELPPQMKSFFELLNPKFKNGWIAKDKSGSVYVFSCKPYKEDNDCWIVMSGEYRRILHEYLFLNEIFDWLSWEDEEPWYIPDLMAEE